MLWLLSSFMNQTYKKCIVNLTLSFPPSILAFSLSYLNTLITNCAWHGGKSMHFKLNMLPFSLAANCICWMSPIGPHVLLVLFLKKLGLRLLLSWNNNVLVVTLALGLRLRQGFARLWAKEGSRESHNILPGVWEGVKEWTLTPQGSSTLGVEVPVDSQIFRGRL
jgi:hypothetical protein